MRSVKPRISGFLQISKSSIGCWKFFEATFVCSSRNIYVDVEIKDFSEKMLNFSIWQNYLHGTSLAKRAVKSIATGTKRKI